MDIETQRKILERKSIRCRCREIDLVTKEYLERVGHFTCGIKEIDNEMAKAYTVKYFSIIDLSELHYNLIPFSIISKEHLNYLFVNGDKYLELWQNKIHENSYNLNRVFDYTIPEEELYKINKLLEFVYPAIRRDHIRYSKPVIEPDHFNTNSLLGKLRYNQNLKGEIQNPNTQQHNSTGNTSLRIGRFNHDNSLSTKD